MEERSEDDDARAASEAPVAGFQILRQFSQDGGRGRPEAQDFEKACAREGTVELGAGRLFDRRAPEACMAGKNGERPKGGNAGGIEESGNLFSLLLKLRSAPRPDLFDQPIIRKRTEYRGIKLEVRHFMQVSLADAITRT
ncbi:hypothetical protein [Rhizobium sp. R634]|uniref:hypothetical protein n=1 Tax=Rhizobium sp. R634 TaxID=1764274 RepID=UPI001FD92275|nr:hypothetical protein [Rhizobium sp. R634]